MATSDAETVCPDASPLSPCLWTAEDEATSPLRQATKTQATRFNGALELQQPRALQLSPASQLKVLSHISELADAPSRATGGLTRPRTQSPQRWNVWGPALRPAAKRPEISRPVVATRPRSQRPKNGLKPTQSQADRLAAEMLEWETCSEGDLFALDAESEQDPWRYQEIYDSEFEGDSTAA